MMEGSSISSGVSTDPGEVNTECYLEDDRNDVELSRLDDSNDEDFIVDKSNLLAEIYSFNHSSKPKKSFSANMSTSSTSEPVSAKDTSRSTGPSSAFSPEKWVRNLNGVAGAAGIGRVHRPSPLHNRIPLRDVTASANIHNTGTNGAKDAAKHGSKTLQRKGTTTRPSLSSFRYVGK